MRDHFPNFKDKRFPLRILKLDFEKDVLEPEKKLIEKYGFVKEEINFIMRYKPTFILFEKESQNEGFLMLHKYFVEERGYDIDVLRTLIVKYPYILSKKRSEIDTFFN